MGRERLGSTVVMTKAFVFVLTLAEDAETATKLLSVPAASGRTISRSLATALLLTVPMFQVRTPDDTELVPWEGWEETNVTPEGSESATTTFEAISGPRF